MQGGNAVERLTRKIFGGRSPQDGLRQKFAGFENSFDYRFTVSYAKDSRNPIAQLCDKYGSDKGEIKPSGHPYPWQSMTYADFYWHRFRHFRRAVSRVFECGLGTNNPGFESSMGVAGKPGASLRVWRDYFPKALVIGADIDKGVLFEEERIRTYYVDQTNPASVASLWSNVGLDDFDLMIDDGLHEFQAGICLFQNSISRLSPEGLYIIEDVDVGDLPKYKAFFEGRDFVSSYVTLYRPREDSGDNNLVVISR